MVDSTCTQRQNHSLPRAFKPAAQRNGRAAFLALGVFLLLVIPIAQAEPHVEKGQRDHAIQLDDKDTVEAEFQIGPAGKIALDFVFADGTSQTLQGVVKSDVMTRLIEKEGRKVPQSMPMPEGLIEFRGMGLGFEYHTRPRLSRYTEAQRENLLQRWESLPPASKAWVPLLVRAHRAGLELWMDGRYCGRVDTKAPLRQVTLKLQAGAAVREVRTFNRTDTGQFLPLEVRRIARPGVMKDASVSLQPGLQQVQDVPMIVADGPSNADVGMAREMQGLRALETNENTSRTSLDAMPESLHFSVPQAFYHRAWVLCAVEADPKRDPVLTTRLTRFGVSGRGGAMADTTLTLPRGDEKPGPGIESVGTVQYTAADGSKIATPLYRVQVDLKIGQILDLLADNKDPYAPMKIGPYLDFEFLGKCGDLEVQTDRRRKPVPTSTSAVHVFGVTLERAPVELRLKQAQPGNIFHNDEKPQTTFVLRADVAGTYLLRWAVTDLANTVLQQHERAVDLLAGDDADITVPLAMPNLGWYGLNITLADGRGRPLLQHDAAFALLGRDTRTAGYESPFGTWWFGGVHYTTRDVNIAGPLLFKAGMRRTTILWTRDTEADFAPWKISLNQIRWPFRLADLEDWPAAENRAQKAISELLVRFPHCQYVDLFHESYDPGTYPPELYGEKYSARDAALAQREDQLYELGVKAARFLRARFPQLKIIAGNSGGSSGIVAVMLRRGFPRDLIDYLGSETTGQTIAPEKLTPHTTAGIWLMAETARKLGYDIPLAGCFEFTCRAQRDLGAQRLAQWYTRDVLLGLANRFPTISPAVIEDVGNAYYDTLWGASGLCERSPLHYPKPAYVALATLTQVLDSAKLVRQIDTGSSSAYALEFERGGQRIYALWTPRGLCEMEFQFPLDTDVTRIGFYGHPETLRTSGRRLTLAADSAVSYIVAPAAATNIRAGRRSFPGHQPPPGTQVISPMDDLAQWQLAPAEQPLTNHLRRPGRFELRQVHDAQKGACIELQLKPTGELPAVVGEYTALRLKHPVSIPGRPHTVGIWVKGDSSWGRIYWEIEDARGERWRSSGGFEGGDWGNHAAIDFDGWCFMTFPLTSDSPVKHLEPAPGLGQWEHQGGDGRLDFPLKLNGLFVMTHRQSLNLTRMQPVSHPVRLRDVSAISNP